MLKVGIIGTGIVAREHAHAIAMVPNAATLAAAADTSPERLAEFGKTFGVSRRYGSAAELIADPQVDLVTVATPPSAHEESVIAALEAGKYVLCEKPLAQSLASAERIAAAAARRPGRLSVSYQLRYAPQYRRMLWLIKNGWIGEVEVAVVERHGYIPHSVVGKGGWWGAWDIAGGGVLMTQMIHELDTMIQAMGVPRSVSAEMDTRYTAIESEDWVEAVVRFDGKRIARCAGSVNSGQMRGGLTIKGSGGSISPGTLALNDPSRLAEAVGAGDAALPDTRSPSMWLPARALRKFARKFGTGEKQVLTGHAMLYSDIVRSIAASGPLPIPASEAMKSLQLCAGAYEAAITGKEVTLPLGASATTFGGVSKASYETRKRPESKPRPVVVLPKSSVVCIGLIGLDTTHAVTFTKLLHDPGDPFHIPGARVVAAYPGGSSDMNISISRVPGFTSELQNRYGVPIVDAPEKVADASDLVFILSSDGRTHPGLFRAVAGGKPVFVDKPFAVSAADAERIFALADDTKTPVFASSAFRYADDLVAALKSIRAGGERIKSCRIRTWLPIEPTQGRYFWYGVHGAEMLLATMGQGVAAVEAKGDANQDTINVWHDDGRESCIVGARVDQTFHVSIETERRRLEIDLASSSASLSARMLWSALDVLTQGRFPRIWRATEVGSVSGNRPGRDLDPTSAETMEVVRLLDAAQRSYSSRQKVTI